MLARDTSHGKATVVSQAESQASSRGREIRYGPLSDFHCEVLVSG